MNTSGPSSRPRKPYPLALLNHLTVPFKRSTCAPLSCGFPPKRRKSEGPQKCVGIVLPTAWTVKACNHTSLVGTFCVGTGAVAHPSRAKFGLFSEVGHLALYFLDCNASARRLSLPRCGLLPCPAPHLSQPQDPGNGLRILDASMQRHLFRLG